MDCEQVKPILDEFADGQLSAADKRMVEEHLRTCPSCGEDLAVIRKTFDLLTDFRELSEPPDFLHKVRDRIEKGQKRWSLRGLFHKPETLRIAFSVGCLALIAVGAWLTYRHFSPPPEQTAYRPIEKRDEPRVVATAKRYGDESTPETSPDSTLTFDSYKEVDSDGLADTTAALWGKDVSSTIDGRATLRGPTMDRSTHELREGDYYWAGRGFAEAKGAPTELTLDAKPEAEAGGKQVNLKQRGSSLGGRVVAEEPVAPVSGKALRDALGEPSVPTILASEHDDDDAVVTQPAPPIEKEGERRKGMVAHSGGGEGLAGTVFPPQSRLPEPADKPTVADEAGPPIGVITESLRLEPTQELAAIDYEPTEKELPQPEGQGVLGPEAGERLLEEVKAGASTKRGAEFLYRLYNNVEFQNGQMKAVGRYATQYGTGLSGVQVLDLEVRDREASMAEIQRDIARLGGTVERLSLSEAESPDRSPPQDHELLVVHLKRSAFSSLLKKHRMRSRAAGLSSTSAVAAEIQQQAEAPKRPAQQDDVITFLIRLITVSSQERSENQTQSEN